MVSNRNVIHSALLFCAFSTLISSSIAFNIFRHIDILERLKRDDGSFLTNSGGPIASTGKDNQAPTVKNNAPKSKIMGSANTAGKCQWELQTKQVINEIADSEDSNEQIFKFLGRASCATFAQCELQCKRLSCNYFLKSSVNDETLMYSVSEAKLAENNWTVSKTYDSFFIKCLHN